MPLSPVPAFLLTAVLAAALWTDVRRDLRRLVSGRNVVLLGIFVWFLFEAVRLPADLARYSQAQYNFGLFCVFVAAAAFLAAYHASRGGIFDSFGRRLAILDDPRRVWTMAVVAFAIGIAPALYFADFDFLSFIESALGYRKRWSGSNPLARARYGGLRDALVELKMFLKPALLLATILLFRRDIPTARRWACGLFVLWMLLMGASSGTRSQLLVATSPVLAALYWTVPSRWQRRAIFALPLVFILLYTWSAAVAATRHSGNFSWSAASQVDYVGFEMFRELVYISSNIPEKLDYQCGYTYYVQLVNPIPRFIWPDKPAMDAGILMARAYGAFNDAGTDVIMTRSPGLIGEMYFNFGLPGILLISAFGGCLVRSWDRLRPFAARSLPAFLVYCAGLFILVQMGRAVTMSMFYGMLALFFLLWCVPIRPVRPRAARTRVTGRACAPLQKPAPGA